MHATLVEIFVFRNEKLLAVKTSWPNGCLGALCKRPVIFSASNINTIETKPAKHSSLNRVINFARKLRLNITSRKRRSAVQSPTHKRNSKKSRP